MTRVDDPRESFISCVRKKLTKVVFLDETVVMLAALGKVIGCVYIRFV